METLDLTPLLEALGPDAQLHAVGGWVRDRLQRKWLKDSGASDLLAEAALPEGDLDLATALHPQEVMFRAKKAGLRAIPTGIQHGTVTVVLFRAGKALGDGTRTDLAVEITTFRTDGKYTDGRRPDSVQLGVTLEEDLSRRDFTFNAMALPVEAMGDANLESRLVDPHGGAQDLRSGVIRAVGDPVQRFLEDGLRSLRACRFASQLAQIPMGSASGSHRRDWPGFELDPRTLDAIRQTLDVSRKVAVERVFVELSKLLAGGHPDHGMALLESSGLLDLWLPEMRPMVGCTQNRHHRFDVWRHTLECLKHNQGSTRVESMSAGFNWALLLHDLGKPPTRTIGDDGEVHFYGHEPISVQMADEVLLRLKASNEIRAKVRGLISVHGVHPTAEWRDSTYRRLLVRLHNAGVGIHEWELFRLSDQLGKGWGETGTPDGQMSGRQWRTSIEQAWTSIAMRLESVRFPGMTAKELALDGRALMDLAGRPGGPWLGQLQKHLLEAVIEDPWLNTVEHLNALAEAWLESPEGRG